MSVIQDYEDQLTEIEDEIQAGIDSLTTLKGNVRAEKVSFVEKRIERARQLFQSYKMEIPDLAPMDRRSYQNKAKDHQTRLNKLLQDLQWVKVDRNRDDLMAGSRAVPTRNTDPSQMEAGQLAQAGVEVQEDTFSSLERSRRNIEQTTEAGRETSAKLKQQTEQVNAISEDLTRIDTTLKRAGRELRAFIRRMATDKVIMCFLMLLVLGIVAAVIVTIVKG